MKKDRCLLEYSDEQESIHINCWSNRDGKWDKEPETNGYTTICESDYQTIYKFLGIQLHSHPYNSAVLKIAWAAFNSKLI